MADGLPALKLKSSSLLQETYPQEVRDQQPIYIKGDSLSSLKNAMRSAAVFQENDIIIDVDPL